ncbi:hypothetical protein [Spirosoma rhododendri]|uniref:Uncharacterized protein n=1 Tax=Spirosoma rhododendri TaxID=2728024 RepID=A0A7L5DQV6_9BACT|nr:hypothetical protein [Spirosoma rhododendri]QJD78928.1 hypothetical protein HH216_11205 [Spirosoma rhododendri]
MKQDNKIITMLAGSCDQSVRNLCRSLAEEGVSAIVRQKESTLDEPIEESKHWSGQPGQDMFFNNWKLLF